MSKPRIKLAFISFFLLLSTSLGAEKFPDFDTAIRLNRAGLVQNREVIKEIKVTDDQLKDIAKALKPIIEKYDLGVSKLQSNAREDYEKLVKEASEQAAKKVDEILKPEQAKRLREIELQAIGIKAYSDPQVRIALGLTEEQSKKLDEVAATYEIKRGKIKRGAKGVETEKTIPGTEVPIGQMDPDLTLTPKQLLNEYLLKSKNILNQKQLEIWSNLIGDPCPYVK